MPILPHLLIEGYIPYDFFLNNNFNFLLDKYVLTQAFTADVVFVVVNSAQRNEGQRRNVSAQLHPFHVD